VPVITLLTDFGLDDEYVGVMKGVILAVNPDAVIVDITHRILPQNLVQAAYTLHAAYRFFAAGAIHVVVVDPGVGTERKIIAAETAGHIFLAPDNGVLSLLLENDRSVSVRQVENETFFLKPVSRTFHGRDIFAPVAAHLSTGLDYKRLGPEIDLHRLTRLVKIRPQISDKGEIEGSIVSIDHFGNLITNIDCGVLASAGKCRCVEQAGVLIAGHRISGLSPSYSAKAKHQPLALIGSRGFMEIALNQGSAEDFLKAAVGDPVKVQP
jgi:S-adenosylmethionine hydrolase